MATLPFPALQRLLALSSGHTVSWVCVPLSWDSGDLFCPSVPASLHWRVFSVALCLALLFPYLMEKASVCEGGPGSSWPTSHGFGATATSGCAWHGHGTWLRGHPNRPLGGREQAAFNSLHLSLWVAQSPGNRASLFLSSIFSSLVDTMIDL